MRIRFAASAIAACLLAAAGGARAGDLVVTLVDAKGAPVSGAVVTASWAGAHAPARYDQPLRITQQDLQFQPFILVVPVGATVVLDNQDKVRHHIYSFSPAKKFELKLFGKDQAHTVAFDKAGAVALGCNIHDQMSAFVKVTDAPVVQRTDAAGRAVLGDLPAGGVVVRVWQPYLRAPGNELSAQVAVPRAGSAQQRFTAAVLSPRR